MREKIVSGLASGIGWGLGMGIALGVTSTVGGGMRPVAKGAVKAALWAREQALVVAAVARERAEDLYHEAIEEREAEQAALRGEPLTLVPAADDSGDSGRSHA